jgi:hypothetical protein
MIRQAELQADSGNLRTASQLCDWILADDRVSACIDSRVQSLLGLTPSFTAGGDKRRSRGVIRKLEVEEDFWAAYPDPEMAQIHTWGLMLGVGPALHGWELNPDHGNRLLPMPEFWHPHGLRFDMMSRKWLMRVAQSGGFDAGQEQDVIPGDGDWILHMPFGVNRPWSRGMWRGLSRLVLLKWLAVQDWARHGERGSALVATNIDERRSEFTKGTTAEQRSELAQDIYARGKDAVIVLPEGFDLKLVEAKANTKQIYEAQIEMANNAIAIAIRGGNLTTSHEGGSRAAIEGQERRGDQVKLRFDASTLGATIHDQSLKWWAEFNFGDSKLAPWPEWPVEEDEDLKTTAETANSAADAAQKFINMGFEIDRKVFADKFGFGDWLKPGAPVDKPKAKPDPPDEEETDEEDV